MHCFKGEKYFSSKAIFGLYTIETNDVSTDCSNLAAVAKKHNKTS